MLEILGYIKRYPKRKLIVWLLTVGATFNLGILLLILWLVIFDKGINIPGYTIFIPIGLIIHGVGWIYDSLGHDFIYKGGISKEESSIHIFMMYLTGLPLWVSMFLAFFWPKLMLPAIIALFVIKFVYTMHDEFVFHIKRCDFRENLAHYLLFLGQILLEVSAFIWIYVDNLQGLSLVRTLF